MNLRRNHDDRTHDKIIGDLYVCRQTCSSETLRWVASIAFAWCRPWASLQCPMQCPTTNPHTPLPKAQCPVPKANARCPVRSTQSPIPKPQFHSPGKWNRAKKLNKYMLYSSCLGQ